ncbi:39S ribosomal protein L9; mitochondrial [Camelus dromedarius]|uniref:Large ribosomal subunit protein bL9m n=1 Tax=Camelus dromedarius TaxID=9838 RepID=A0A5N4EBG5_CAMDR|nr:39S ribosomal protein L9; mitochondrial [Camelus dromedarius]
MIISSPEIIFILKVTCKATVASAAGMKQDSLGFEQYRGGGILDSDLRTIQEEPDKPVEELGIRGDLASVKKSEGRNHILLPQRLAVYASPENKKLFEEEKSLRREGR